jgi:hypothetical protein
MAADNRAIDAEGRVLRALPQNPSRGVDLIKLPGREQFDIEAMHAAIGRDISSLLSQQSLNALHPYSQVLRKVEPLGIDSTEIVVEPSFLVAVLLDSYSIFPSNRESAPYSSMEVPNHWLTNWQTRTAFFEYLKLNYRDHAQHIWHGLLNDAETKGTEKARRVRPVGFSQNLEAVKALSLDEVTFNHVMLIDRYFCNERAREILEGPALRLLNRLVDGDVIDRFGKRTIVRQHTYSVLRPEALKDYRTE